MVHYCSTVTLGRCTELLWRASRLTCHGVMAALPRQELKGWSMSIGSTEVCEDESTQRAGRSPRLDLSTVIPCCMIQTGKKAATRITRLPLKPMSKEVSLRRWGDGSRRWSKEYSSGSHLCCGFVSPHFVSPDTFRFRCPANHHLFLPARQVTRCIVASLHLFVSLFNLQSSNDASRPSPRRTGRVGRRRRWRERQRCRACRGPHVECEWASGRRAPVPGLDVLPSVRTDVDAP